MKSIISNTKGQLDINLAVTAILGLILASAFLVIGIVVLQGVVDGGDVNIGSAATGTITFSGSATDGDVINITIDSTVYSLEVDDDLTNTSGYIPIDVNATSLAEIDVAGAMVTSVNGNTSLAALLTSTNTSTTNILTADARGTTANAYGTTESGANMAWAATTMAGGVVDDTLYSTMTSVVDDIGSAMALAGTLILVIIGVAILMMLAGVMVIMRVFR